MAIRPLAVVTGASSGIGQTYANRLAARGYDLILVGRNQLQLQQKASELLVRHGATCEVLPLDLARREQLAIVEDRLASDGSIALLVNSAGLVVGGPIAEANSDRLAGMLDVNVTALTCLCAAAAGNFGRQRRGAIINIGSAMAFIDTASAGAYAASKAYVLSLSQSLELELRNKGVHVQVVLPGYTSTPMLGDDHGVAADMLMDVDTLVDAALVGFDRKELITIPSLDEPARFVAWDEARAGLRPHISRRDAATRYRPTAPFMS